MLQEPGVYMIVSIATGERYVGGTEECFERRFVHHRTRLATNTHHAPALQAIYNRYGMADLKFIPLKAFPKEEVRRREQEAVARLKPTLNARVTPQVFEKIQIDKPIEDMTIEEMAQAAGVHPATIKYRLSVGASGESLLVGRRTNRVDVGDGRKLSAKEIAQETGLALPTVHGRIARGVTGAALLRKRFVRS